MTGADAWHAWPRAIGAALYGPRERMDPYDAMALFLPPDAADVPLQMRTPHSKRHAEWLRGWRDMREDARGSV